MNCKIKKREKISSGKWLYMENIEYVDRKGSIHSWESVMRTNTQGAVVIIAEMSASKSFILVRQYRPPAGGYVIEFPAGLIDPGEKPEETALRELFEETGYKGTISEKFSPSYSSPGMTGETVQIIKVKVDEKLKENINAVPKFDGAEDIETFIVKKDELLSFLNEREASGDLIDSKVISYALGLNYN